MGRRVARRSSRLADSIRFKFDSNSIQIRFDSIRFVTARPTATDADDGPPPPRARAGDDGRRSTSRREVPNRGRRIESNRIERSRVDVSLAPGRGDATTRCKRAPARPVGASRGCAFCTRARACVNTSNPGSAEARARGGCAHSSAEVERTLALALGRESASSCRACWRCSTSTGRSPSLERNRTTS